MANLFDQSYEIVRYETIPAGWSNDRRCGYIFYSEYQEDRFTKFWYCYIADTNGNYNKHMNYSEQRCDCPQKYGSYTCTITDTIYIGRVYTAVCLPNGWVDSDDWTNSSARSWIKSHTCPKGWGKSSYFGTNKDYVQCAQGYVVGYRKPIYGYVTNYRTKYYTYISSRVAKS